MSTPSPEHLEREQDKLFLTDAELIRRLGVPEKIGYETLRELDDKPSGFPKKQKIWGDRRYWPAVLAYLNETLVPKFRIGAASSTERKPEPHRLPRRHLAELPMRRSTQ